MRGLKFLNTPPCPEHAALVEHLAPQQTIVVLCASFEWIPPDPSVPRQAPRISRTVNRIRKLSRSVPCPLGTRRDNKAAQFSLGSLPGAIRLPRLPLWPQQQQLQQQLRVCEFSPGHAQARDHDHKICSDWPPQRHGG